ncbi:DUF4382 domain-containing protein [Aliifodinibius sp. S!AR15-10]|uniref:DUF4382 domain-containing protein n=1 Tax=Aliifodinibius sp. S!AR15-10 TaxID=2950437 RepID=UPI00285F2F66|nr:DUF4382 domain-containing protein [Aliifodinibius sp. S!AR15-10]MDR8389565.1 DUF4382 domain-containing protein [Aliifodinibius sp. S!AR15-10]
MSIWNSESTIYKALQGLFAVALIAFIAVSCSDINTSGTQTDKAKLNVHLTDAPADYEEVNIDVQGLRIHYTPATSDTVDPNPERDGKWIDLPVEPMNVNLLELQNGVDTLLASAELEPGSYRELRLMLGGNNNVVIDGSTHDLKVPSGQASGYKIKFKTELEEGEELDVTIDFDASRSVHKAGKSGMFILKPVLKAFVSEGDDMETGSISGIVEPVEADPSIFATMDDDTVATAQPDDNGSFLLQGLEPGDYEVLFDPANEDYMDTQVNATVEAGEETDIGTITLEENQ